MRRNKKTDELLRELKSSQEVKAYLENNKAEIRTMTFKEYIDYFIDQKHLDRPSIIRDAQLDRSYGYQILQGKKKPSRNKIIQLCFGLRLSVEESQYLLESADVNRLYPRNSRDSIIMFGLNKGLDLLSTDALLEECAEETLL